MFLVDNGKDFECGVEDRVDERGIDGYTCNHRFREKHTNWSCQLFGDDGVEVNLDVLVRMMISFIPGFLSEADSFLFEEKWTVYFRETEEGHYHDDKDPDGENPSNQLLASGERIIANLNHWEY